MSTPQYDTLQLVGRHVPEEGSGPFANSGEAFAAGYDTLHPVTGVYQLGVLVDGAFVTILEEPAGRFFHLVEHAKANTPEQPADTTQPQERQTPQAQGSPTSEQSGAQ